MCVPAKNDVDAADPTRQLEIHIHAVVGEQHHNLSTIGTHRIHHLLALLVTDTETPVLEHVARIGQRGIGKSLPDDTDRDAVHFPNRVWLEYLARILIICRLALEGGILRQHDVLCKELNRREVFIHDLTDPIHAVGEFPMPGHDIHPEQLAGIHHVLAVGPKRCRRPLPCVASIQQQAVGP